MGNFDAIVRLRQKARGKSFSALIAVTIAATRQTVKLSFYRLRYRRVQFGQRVDIQGRLRIYGPGKVRIGDRCSFTSYSRQPNILVTLNPESTIMIGNHSSLNGAEIVSQTSIEFGEYCIVGDAVITDTDHHRVEIDRWSPDKQAAARPIKVEDNVWIGGRCMIFKGVTIGRNSVVGAATVVRRPVPENSVVIGNPQQIVKTLDASIEPYRYDD